MRRRCFLLLSATALQCGVLGSLHATAAEAPEATLAELAFGDNERAFTPEPTYDSQPFYRSWKNDYVANIPTLCSGEVAGFTASPLRDADCREPFQFLLERGTGKVRYGCIKCDGNLHLTPIAAPYATCDRKPVCSGLSIAYLYCFLKNDTANDMFSCLMGVDFRSETSS